MTRVMGAGTLGKNVDRRAQEIHVAPERLRRWIASTALLQSFNIALANGHIENYCVKGGFAIELRNPALARASQDIDLVISGSVPDRALLESVLKEPWTLFRFEIKEEKRRDHATRFALQAIYNSVKWSTVQLDIIREPVDTTESVAAHDVTVYGLSPAQPIPCLSRSEQMAQYLHAITLPAIDGKRRNRARNILDLFVFDLHVPCDDQDTLAAAKTLFARRATHQFPPAINIPEAWLAELDVLARELGLDVNGHALGRFVSAYITRILGVSVRMNYEYQFVVLTADDQAASGNIMRSVFKASPGLEAFAQLTAEEGYRLVTMLEFPGMANGRHSHSRT